MPTGPGGVLEGQVVIATSRLGEMRLNGLHGPAGGNGMAVWLAFIGVGQNIIRKQFRMVYQSCFWLNHQGT